jgi:hypothetical protein
VRIYIVPWLGLKLATNVGLTALRSNVVESAYMPEGNKIWNENTFCESQAAVQTPDLACTVPLPSTYEEGSPFVKAQFGTMQEKNIDGEVSHVLFRDSE